MYSSRNSRFSRTVALFSTEGVAFAFSSFCGLDSNSSLRPDGMEIKMTYLTSPKVAGNSAVIAPPKSSTGLNPDIVFDVILSMMSLLAGWLVGVRRPSRKIVSVPRFANVIPNKSFDIEFSPKNRKKRLS